VPASSARPETRELPEDAPRERPLTYPGRWPETSCLVTAENVLRLQPVAKSRSSAALVSWVDGFGTSAGWSAGDEPVLRDVLTVLNAAPMSQRVPVLAIGSNASVAQLRHKARSQHFPLLIPMVLAEVTGLEVGHAAKLVHLGYIPATVRFAPQAHEQLFVQFLDRQQLREMDATEVGYRRIWLPAEQVPVRLDSGETLGGVYAYVADGGYLVEAGEFIPRATQSRIIERVRTASPELTELLGSDVDEAVRRAKGSAQEWRTRVASAMAEAGLVAGTDQLEDYPDQRQVPPRSYAAIPSWGGIDGSAGGWPEGTVTVAPTSDDLTRDGESVVAISEGLRLALGNPKHVVVRGFAEHDQDTHYRLGAVAAVRRLPVVDTDSTYSDTAHGGPEAAQIDETLRIALGVDLGDAVILTPVKVKRPTWPDLIFGRPNHVTLRVNLADTSTTERPVCLVSELTLELLGIGSGDDVILEGFPEPGGRVPSVTLKAFRAPAEVVEARHTLMGGSWGSRFPSPRDTFGADPDIPEVYLDAATRHQLGLGSQQMGILRARASRLQRFIAELRELMLILVLAAVGLIGIVDDPGWSVGMLAVLVALALFVTVVRLRDRLSHSRSLRRAYQAQLTPGEAARDPRR